MDTMRKVKDVFIVGGYFCDLVFTGLPELPRLGHEVYSQEFHLIPGGVYNAAIALHRLGVDIVWPCQFGNDPFSQYVKNEALKEGVDSRYFSDLDHPSLHITAAFSFQDERAFLSYSDAEPKMRYAELIRQTNPRWIYLTRLFLGKALEPLVDAGRSVGAKIFMDCQAHSRSLAEMQVQEALRAVDFFSPNRAEAEKLTGNDVMTEMLEMLTKFAPVVIIKDGANGSYLSQNDTVIHQPAKSVSVIDTTGAGDNFDSGFLYGQINGFSMEKCLQIGNYCGGLSAQGFGGTSTSPTEKQVLDHFS
jgi:sugar/nucleoside kinase (ribokinase family)